jgi:hypothetical protein
MQIVETKDLTRLEVIIEQIWAMLNRGVTEAGDPFHTPVLGTTALDGSSSLRAVILRQVIAPERTLICHTDARSPKVREIEHNPKVSWLFYHPQQQTQLRLTGQATLHADDHLADQQWAATRLSSRLIYCVTMPPGTPTNRPTSGLPDVLETRPPTLAESEAGRPNFLVIACRVASIDWLNLRNTGHRRARFTWPGDQLAATWLTP